MKTNSLDSFKETQLKQRVVCILIPNEQVTALGLIVSG